MLEYSVAGSAAPAIMIGLFVSFGGLCFGYDTGYERVVEELAHQKTRADTFTLS
jgi:hypothetical protein